MDLDKVINKIMKSNSIAITFHSSPDGDSIGSATALTLALRKLGKKCNILSKEKLSNTFSYIKIFDEVNGEDFEVPNETELLIVLDCGDVKRINANINLQNRNYEVINIDHHMSNEMYGDLNYVDTKAAAVGEIIYKVIEKLNIVIDNDMAEGVYTSLLTDTGSFRHSNTTKNTHEVAGKIIDTGINFSEIHRKIFDNKEFNRIKLYGKVIETMTLECNSNAVFMILEQSMLEELNLENTDTSDLLMFGTKVASADVTVLIKEAEGGVKVSLRSKEKVDVRKVAEKFDGGGHIRAAGCFIEKNPMECKKQLIDMLEKELI